MNKSALLRVLFFVVILSTGSHCFARGLDVNVQDVVTSQGNKYWHIQEDTLPMVAVTMAFKNSGSLYDPVSKKGLAALVSSVIARGTVAKDGESIAKKLQGRGVTLDVYADGDNIYVSIKTLAENLDFALSAVGSSLIYASIDEAVFNVEKEKQKADIRGSAMEPTVLASEMLDKIMFGDDPHAYPVQGTIPTVESIMLEDVESYRRENFDLDKMVIGVTGNVSKEVLSDILDRSFAGIPRGQNTKEIQSAHPKLGLRGYVKYSAPQSVIVFATKGVSYKDPKYHVAEVLNNALGGIGLSSVLMQELRQRMGITYNVSSSLRHGGGADLLQGALFTDSTTAKEGVKALLKTINSVKEKGLDEKSFKIAKADLINSFVFAFLKRSSVAAELVQLQLRGLGVDYIRNYSSIYDSVTLRDVNEFAKDFFGDFTIVEVGSRNNIGASIT
ncbi:M16 family metallopeptidase [Candidatus Anaplasma sp. TIGMIC]|uniref:M16 family metallopeptidase n=1 Tax=Candidatus Anaplasma sp. TIGMIC TaxID=3020713 RepID=UPI00232F23B5|nr:pitrilysin family protein [Candidatus Anaplasma sp. TIGMIC]MDB1135327.1 pitrilysin family protein [Candidatus Anaplasma sp. TIGMIC]